MRRIVITTLTLAALTACAPTADQWADARGGKQTVLELGAVSDVKLTKCEFAAGGGVSAAVSVTNSTRKIRSYLIVAEVLGADGSRLSELNAVANAVRPDRTVTAQAVGFTPNVKPVACHVVTVTAFHRP